MASQEVNKSQSARSESSFISRGAFNVAVEKYNQVSTSLEFSYEIDQNCFKIYILLEVTNPSIGKIFEISV